MRKRPSRDERGFTLLELLVVIAILGLLIGLVAPAALRQLGSARTSVARQSIERVASILDMYKLDVGSYPTTDQGLRALVERPTSVTDWNGPYLKGNVPVDPWNRPYTYRDPSAARDTTLTSAPPDRPEPAAIKRFATSDQGATPPCFDEPTYQPVCFGPAEIGLSKPS